MYRNPLSQEKILELFTLSNDGQRLVKRESTTLELKESFNLGNMAVYFRTIASFANRNGGYIIFGVKDSPKEIVGLKEKNINAFENLKIEEFTQNLNEYFTPEIRWEHCTFELKEKIFGIIYVYKLENKPAVCKKNYDAKDDRYSLKDGDIYYRYSGRSQKIKHSELLEIIEEKRKKEEKMWLEYLIRSAKIGIENIGLINFKLGNVQTQKINSIYIDEKLLGQIKFIQEGNFVEKDGAPALKLLGEFESMNGEKIIIKNEKQKIRIRGISEIDIIEAFLMDKDILEEVEEYIKAIVHCSTGFLPIYFLLNMQGTTIQYGIDLIENVNIRTNAKIKILERLKEKRSEKTPITKKYKEIYSQYIDLIKNESLQIKEEEVVQILRAILCMENDEIIEHIKYLKELLFNMFSKYYSGNDRTLVSFLRRAVCRIDEVFINNE